MRLGVRCDGDAGQEAGTGHVYRSLEYVRMLHERHDNLDVRFFMRAFPEGITMVEQAGHTVIPLPVKPSKEDFIAPLQTFSPDLLIIDTLGTDDTIMDVAKATSRKVITFDDLESSGLRADSVINGILWATRMLPTAGHGATVHQGVEYMPLRMQFAGAGANRSPVGDAISEIMICTGGHDETNFGPQIFEALSQLPGPCNVTFYAGPSHERLEVLEAQAATLTAGGKRFAVRQNVPDMAQKMIEADLAIFTGGTLLFEAAASGLPSIIVCSQEHQAPQAAWFHEQGASISLGFMETIDKDMLVKTVLSMDKKKRQQLSEAGQTLVDGKGMERVVDILSNYFEA